MKFQYLLIGTSLSLIPQTINAQCVATQDCATLGYTETSCSDGSGVKCPFGNKWACFESDSEIKNQLCSELGFTQTCTGTNQISGVGKPCNGKYAECTCTSGYEWKNGSCQKQVLNGPDGDVYKCDGTVVGVKTSDMNFYVAMRDLGKMSWHDADSSCQSYIFCNNLKGTLPGRGQLSIIYRNKSTINNLLATNCGTQLTENWYWSSDYCCYSPNFATYYYSVNMSDGDMDYYSTSVQYPVRPILTSW